MIHNDRPLLRDGPLILRAPVVTDVAARIALGNVPEIVHMFGVPLGPATLVSQSQAEGFVREHSENPLAWVIEHEGKMIGGLKLHNHNPHDQRASIAIGILDAAKLGQGLGTRAMRLVLDYAFDVLGLHRISIRVIDYNARAIAAYRKLGFVEEGREREAALVGDKWYDDIMMGLLVDEWQVAS